MPASSKNLLARSPDFFDNLVFHVHPPNSCSGVHMIGHLNPAKAQFDSSSLMISALLMCEQFQVNR